MTKLNTNKKKFTRKLEKVNFVGRTHSKDVDKIVFNGNELINLSSNDYLGLSKNPRLIKESRKWLNGQMDLFLSGGEYAQPKGFNPPKE